MPGKICPFLSQSANMERACAGERCMLFVESSGGGSCGLVHIPTQTVRRLDTLSAQMQEIQVVLNMQSN